MVGIMLLTTCSVERSLCCRLLHFVRGAREGLATQATQYPKGNIIYTGAICQQGLCQPQLSKCLNGLGLYAIGFASGGFIGSIVKENNVYAKANKVTPSECQ